MFESEDPPTTVFEIAPNGSGGETFWIYEIDQPGKFFERCGNQDEALDRLIDSEKSPDEQIETCGYTLILDSPEDPSSDRSGDPPEKPIVIEVIEGRGNGQRYSFYEIEDPRDIFGNTWGNTPEMVSQIEEAGISPIVEYENVSLKFQRPYGAL